MKIIAVLFILFILSFPASAAEDLLDFNPDYERLDFSVEGTLTANFLFVNPALEFSGTGKRDDRNSDWLTPLVEIEEANFNVFIFSFGEDSATELAEDLIGSMVGVADSQEEAMEDYYLVEDEDLFFVYRNFFNDRPPDREIIRIIEDEKIQEMAEKGDYTEGKMFGGKMVFQDGLLTRILGYSDDWWADLDVEWKSVDGKYSFPKRATGQGYHDRKIDLEVDFFDYEVY